MAATQEPRVSETQGKTVKTKQIVPKKRRHGGGGDARDLVG